MASKEEDILASLGSTLASSSAYESDVLNAATLDSAPRLTGVGFPDLHSLVPSYCSRNNRKPRDDTKTKEAVPYVLSVLSKTRSALNSALTSEKINAERHVETEETNILRFKVQILLTYLTTVAGIPLDELVDVKQEHAEERWRRLLLLRENNNDDHVEQRRSPTYAFSNNNEDERQIPKKRQRESKEPLNEPIVTTLASRMSNTEKLELIKQNSYLPDDYLPRSILSSSKTASFGLQALTAHNENRAMSNRRREKVGMMGMKRQLREEDGCEWTDPEVLFQKRLERRERRRLRKLGIRNNGTVNGNAGAKNYGNIEENSSPPIDGNIVDLPEGTPLARDKAKPVKSKSFVSKSKKQKAQQTTAASRKLMLLADDNDTLQDDSEDLTLSLQSSTAIENNISGSPIVIRTADSEESSSTRQQQKNLQPQSSEKSSDTTNETPSQALQLQVYCPICSRSIDVTKDMGEADAFLSRHIQSCERVGGGNNGMGLRRSTRLSTNIAAKTICYKEADDNDGINDENIAKEGFDNTSDKDASTVGSLSADEVAPKEAKLVSAVSSKKSIAPRASSLHGSNQIKKETTKFSAVVEDFEPLQRRPKLALDDMDEHTYEDRIDDWIDNGISDMTQMAEQDSTEIPPGAVVHSGGLEVPAWINNRLFGYQRTGLRWMWELHRQGAGGIVGDEMGLGKTVQICSFLGAMTLSRKLNSVLIVAPATILVHWLSELAKWAPGLRRVLIHKSAETGSNSPSPYSRTISDKLLSSMDKWLHRSRSDRVNEPIDERDLQETDPNLFCGTGYVFVTTYENIRRAGDIWVKHHWSYVVLDEGQKIRNPDADVTIACKKIRTPHRLLLSGTPIQNNLSELWSLFDFVFPGRLGTLPTFEAEFADPIKRGGYANASPMQVQLAYRCALVLRDLINPYLLRRQKRDLKEVSRMPGKLEQVLFCRLSARQRAMYESYLNSDTVKNIIRGSKQCFGPITVLRKICNHPDLICGADQASFDSFVRSGLENNKDVDDFSSDDDIGTEEVVGDADESLTERAGKLEVLAKILPLWKEQGHRVLIFTQWKKMLSIIQRFTMLQGWKFTRMDGNTNVASRQHLVDTFNTDTSIFGMLMTTRTGGVGLNLVGADRIILYDPDWNPQTDAQARERAWRFGQTREVTVYRLITAGTIEEKIYHRQIFKSAVTNQVLQDPKQRRLFSQGDLRDLFTLKPDRGSISKGGDGLTETGEITRGHGVVDVNIDTQDDDDAFVSNNDNKSTLDLVLKSKGLAGVFDHDFVDKPSAKKSFSLREMEEQARRVAEKAAKALRESVTDQDKFTPTWTGSVETDPVRFGNTRKKNSGLPTQASNSGRRFEHGRAFVDADGGFGGARTVGMTKFAAGRNTTSGDLIAQLKKRRILVASGGHRDTVKDD